MLYVTLDFISKGVYYFNMDKELLKRYMQAMAETGTTEGKVPVTHNGKGYDVSIKLDKENIIRVPNKFLKEAAAPDISKKTFRAGVMPMNEQAKLVRSVSGTTEEIIAHLEEEIQYIEQYYINRDKAKGTEKLV